MTPGAWLLFALAVPMAVASVEVERLAPGQGSEGTEGDAIAFDLAPGESDFVQVRQGTPRLGTVESFSGALLEVRTLEDEVVRVAHDDLVAINFHVGQLGAAAQLPTDFDPEKDLVFTYDGSVSSTDVTAITADAVMTEQRTFERGSVNLILFGIEGLDDESSDPRPSVPAPEQQDDGSTGEITTPKDEGRPPIDPMPIRDIRNPCPDDRPLGGWTRWEWEADPLGAACSPLEEVTAWFRLVHDDSPLPGAGAVRTALDPAALAIVSTKFVAADHYVESIRKKCEPTGPTSPLVCHGDWQTWSGTPDTRVAEFYPLMPHLVSAASKMDAYTVECRDQYQVYVIPVPLNAGFLMASSAKEAVGHFRKRVPQGPCWKQDAPYEPTDECLADPGRFAAIPFTGEATENKPGGPGDSLVRWSKIAWQVCCGCGERPAARPAVAGTESRPDEEEDCYELAALTRRYYGDGLEQLRKQLDLAAQGYERHRQEMIYHREGFDSAMGFCAAADLSLILLQSLALNLTQFVYPGSYLRFMGMGDALPPQAALPGSGLAYVESSADIREALQALAVFSYFARSIDRVSSDASPAELKQHVFECAGKIPTQGLYDSALAFTQHFEALVKALRPVYQRYKKVLDLELETGPRTEQAVNKCVACANEHGKDPVRCLTDNPKLVYSVLELVRLRSELRRN